MKLEIKKVVVGMILGVMLSYGYFCLTAQPILPTQVVEVGY